MNTKTIISKLITGYIIALVFVFPILGSSTNVVSAQINIPPNSNTPTQDSSTGKNLVQYSGVQSTIEDYLCTPTGDQQDLVHCVNKLYRLGVAVGGMLLVFFIVLAGYLYITGGENGKTKAKELIFSTLTGVGVLLTSYLLLNFINPSLTTFRPIQPPIFSAEGLPDCEDIGFEDDCILTGGSGEKQVLAGGGTGGTKVPCPNKKLVSLASLGLPDGKGSQVICEEFGKKLLVAYNATKDTPWVITRTTTGKAESQCHKPGNDYTGTCADIDFTSAKDVKNVESWNKLCRALRSAGVYPHNEVGHAKDGTVDLRKKLTDCGGFNQQTYATGDHIHAMWKSGVK